MESLLKPINKSLKTLGILGCGWLGISAAELFIKNGWSVKGSVRDPLNIKKLKSKGIIPFVYNLGDKGTLISSFSVGLDLLIISIPPAIRNDPAANYLNTLLILSEQLNQYLPLNCRILFVSTSGVYPTKGGPFSEKSKWKPDTDKSLALLSAERIIKKLPQETSVIRFAGLIGPDRHPVRSLSGKSEINGGNLAANLIEKQDAVRLLWHLKTTIELPKIINGVYPQKIKKATYYYQKAKALGIPAPLFLDSELPIDRLITSEVSIGFSYELTV
jgi:nucleoside-diphosphate-sugar epimerase